MTDLAKLREDYLSGMTVEQCSTKYRMTVPSVREFVRRNKLVSERDSIKANTLQKMMKKLSRGKMTKEVKNLMRAKMPEAPGE